MRMQKELTGYTGLETPCFLPAEAFHLDLSLDGLGTGLCTSMAAQDSGSPS